jgi:hypothetical protein
MSNLISLCTGKSFDTTKQVLQENQIVIHCGGGGDKRYVVSRVECKYGEYIYHLINTETKKFSQVDIVTPLHEKFGIGFYYNALEVEFMDAFEVAILRSKAEQIAKVELDEWQKDSECKEQQKAIGRQRLEKLLPTDAKAVIIACLHKNKSDPMTDYYGFSCERSVILGFSSHTKNDFAEMRKCASNFEETKHLSEKGYENRENYTGGFGYYLGESRYSGWVIKKEKFYGTQEQIIERYALIAGKEENICISATSTAEKAIPETITGDFIIVDYSDKALAVFGDTKPVKDQLSAMGGRFNPRLTHEGEKKAGWIFSKSKRAEVEKLLSK